MPGTFDERMRYLAEQVGDGDITAGCEVNQAYAQNQHENRSFRHTVGRVRYLGDPLMENAFNIVDGMARAVITEDGSRIRDEMVDIAEDMSQWVFANAPRDPDIGDVLANSGSPYVVDDGIEIYHRPPVAPRRMGDDHSNW